MDKKNTLLLTVIAIATLLVAVVGATFAYFTAQTTGSKDAPVNVTTETTNSVLVQMEDQDIKINANMTNFDENAVGGDREQGTTDEAEATISFTAGKSVQDAKVCYNVDFIIESSDFDYSSENGGKKPELVLEVSKDAGNTGEFTPVTVIKAKTTETNIDYKSDIGEDALDHADNAKINGFDITKAVADTYQIPSDGATNYEHQITAPANQTVTDKWKFKVTLINYNFDQSKGDTNLAGKTLSGKIEIKTHECA